MSDTEIRKLIDDLRLLCEKQDAELKRIAEAPLQTVTVGYISETFVYVGANGNFTRLLKPAFALDVGDLVLCHPMTNQIVDICEKIPYSGLVCTVKSVLGLFAEVDGMGNDTRVMIGKFTPEKGDRVILDGNRAVIVENLGRQESIFNPDSIPNVKWDDIGGLEEAKQIMREAIEWPHKYGDIFKAYNKRSCKGVLLWGPPGTGKTMLGKAAAYELAQIYGATGAETGFMYIKGPEILNKYVGASEGAVRRIFAQATLHREKNGYPCVVFIDEADAILGKRGSHGSALSSTLVPMFLTEMDGMDESSALVILATNRQDVLDPAVVRDGRIDRKIKITRPDRESAVQIVSLNLKKVPLNGKLEKLADSTVEEVFSDDRRLFRFSAEDDNYYLRLRDTINGAMLAGIVDMATSFAIRRDINAKSAKHSGVTAKDLLRAVNHVDLQARDLNHEDNIHDFLQVNGLKEDSVKMDKSKPKVNEAVLDFGGETE